LTDPAPEPTLRPGNKDQKVLPTHPILHL
jgi:hypothetical protein